LPSPKFWYEVNVEGLVSHVYQKKLKTKPDYLKTVRLFYFLRVLLGFFVFGNSNDLTAFVMSAFGAYSVREAHFTAIAALGEV
jgi:hypothetical protein